MDGSLLLAQHTTQFAAALRATVTLSAPLPLLRRARVAVLAVARASLLTDCAQWRRLLRLALPVPLQGCEGVLGKPSRRAADERFAPHVQLLDLLERLALLAELSLFARESHSCEQGDETGYAFFGAQTPNRKAHHSSSKSERTRTQTSSDAANALQAALQDVGKNGAAEGWCSHWLAALLVGSCSVVSKKVRTRVRVSTRAHK